MPKLLTLGLSVICVIAGVALLVSGDIMAGLLALLLSTPFDALFVYALMSERGASRRP